MSTVTCLIAILDPVSPCQLINLKQNAYTPMLQYKEIHPVILAILLCASVIPLMSEMSPKTAQYFVYDIRHMKKLEIWRLFTGIFLTRFSIALLMRLYFAYKFMAMILEYNCRIDTVPPDVELALFVMFMFVPLVLSNLIEHLNTFSECIPLALIRYFSELIPESFKLNFMGLVISPKTYSLLSLCVDYILNGGRTKVYYGLLYAMLYVNVRRHVSVPKLLLDGIEKMKKIRMNGIFGVVREGRRVGSRRKK